MFCRKYGALALFRAGALFILPVKKYERRIYCKMEIKGELYRNLIAVTRKT